MKRHKFKLNNRHSASLMSMVGRKRERMTATKASMLSGMASTGDEAPAEISEADRVSVLIDTKKHEKIGNALTDIGTDPETLSGSILSAEINAEAAEMLLGAKDVKQVQTKKRSKPSMDNALEEIDRRDPTGANPTGYDGSGVVVAVVDSGFDLTHPMFHDAGGALRVDALLDQTAGGQTFDNAQLQTQLAAGNAPGADTNGHGTHVASIAAGSAFGPYEGVAPGARFVLVKTDFLNTDKAVSWAFNQAAGRPCVVNLSLGHHFGSHDGTSLEERLYDQLQGPGKLICVAAGNEQNDQIHLGSHFFTGETRTIKFDIFRQSPPDTPVAVITLWYNSADRFDFEVVTPTGQTLDVPALGNTSMFQGSFVDIELTKKRYLPSQLKQVQIVVSFDSSSVANQWLKGWSINMRCRRATVGRIDGWFNNSGYGEFHGSDMVEASRTVGMSGTGEGTITVASHVSRNQWDSDAGPQIDESVVLGRNSPFSSLGPNRAGLEKPDISAPGQYVTAALSTGSSLSSLAGRADTANQLVSIEGTSMACPVVAGAIALMLEKRPTLTTAECRQILANAARRDLHTGSTGWTPAYGYGKISVAEAVSQT